MPDNSQFALYNLGNAILLDLQENMHKYGRVATGKTINDIKLNIDGTERFYIDGPAYLLNLEFGRKATHATGPFPRYGGLTFKESLRLWMQAKGIDEGKKSDNAQYGPVLWAIYVNINKKGFAGTPGVISGPLSDRAISKAMDDNLGNLANIYAAQVLDQLFK